MANAVLSPMKVRDRLPVALWSRPSLACGTTGLPVCTALKHSAGSRLGMRLEARRSTALIRASASDSAQPIEPTITSKSGNLRLVSLLPVIKFSLFVVALVKVAAPQKFAELAFDAPLLDYGQQLLQLTAITLISTAAVFHVVQQAAQNDRLGSDTYQRLNLSTFAWALGQAAVFVAYQGFTIATGFATVSSLLIAATSWSLYIADGKRSVQQALSDAGRGLVSSFRSLVQVSNTVSGLWAASSIALGLFGAKLLWTTPDQQGFGSFLLGEVQGGLPLFFVQALGVHVLLLASVAFNLKDAAERDRIKASTFQTLAKGLALTTLLALAQTFRLAPTALKGSPNTQVFFRVLQVVLAGTGLLSLFSLEIKEKDK